jgi:bifunctional non-homologous end joining protein LigD
MAVKERGTPKKTSKKAGDREIKVGSHTIRLTNQQKIYWPDEKITKGDMINYYNTISRFILPYLKDRPESLKRNPNGIVDEGFFHKDAGDEAPSWVTTKKIYSESVNKDIDYIICNDKATLLYMNNLGCIELNPWNSRISKPEYPDYLVIDIDPSEENSFDQVIEVALTLKEILQKAGANGYCKTSGASGLHVFIPLGARYTYEEVREFAKILATITQQQLQEFTTIERALNKRNGRIYIDYLQNKKGQTLASVYCLRPRPGATASTPLDWKEVKKGLTPDRFNIRSLPSRLEKIGDIFRPVLQKGINVQKVLAQLEKV